MDRADSPNAIREAHREIDQFGENESETMSRLKEHKVKRGEAKLEHFSGSQRRMVNHHRTGVVSLYWPRDLLKLLKMRFEHLLIMFDVQ
jgi:hypothetical protein